MEFVGPAEEAALTEDAAPGEDKDASLPAPHLGPTAAPSVSESPPLLPDELAAVVDLPPWHQAFGCFAQRTCRARGRRRRLGDHSTGRALLSNIFDGPF